MPTKLTGTKFSLSDDFSVKRSTISVATTVSVKSFGAKGDGVTDDTAAITEALTYAVANAPATLHFATGTYRVTGTLGTHAASDVTIDFNGSTIDCSGAATSPSITFFNFLGTYDATAALTDNVAKAATTIPCDSSGFAVGDMVRLYSDEVYDPDRTAAKFGEIGYIASIPGGTSVVLSEPIDFAYTTANSATIQKLTPCRNVHLRDGKIVGSAANNDHMAIRMRVATDCSVRGIRSYYMDRMHLQITDGSRCQVIGNWFTRSNHASLGYGTSFADAAQDIVCAHNHYYGVRHSLSTNNNVSTSYGVVRRVIFEGNTVEAAAQATGGSGGDAIDTHSCAEQICILNNTVKGATASGINFEARTGVIAGNVIRGCQRYGIHVNPRAAATSEIAIRDNDVRDIGLGGESGYMIAIRYSLFTASAINTVVSGNYAEATENAIAVTGTATKSHTRAVISGNVAVGTTGAFPALTGSYLRQAAMIGNTAIGGAYAIRLSHVLRTSVTGNAVENIGDASASYGIRVDGTSTNVIVTGNAALDSTTSGTTTAILLYDTGVTYSSVQSNVTSGYDTSVTIGAGTGNAQANNVAS